MYQFQLTIGPFTIPRRYEQGKEWGTAKEL